uniref:Uncharacterized protein n=1 Tax=Periophthalmus magnuspinnatus TaxID=409849 RepID=A0A3B4A724_9GOBI
MVALTAPYIAGFLAFRETPFLLEALKRLEKNKPELMPQVRIVQYKHIKFGLACHLGVLSGLPCVGVAKNLLQVEGVYKNEEHQSQITALQKGGDSFPLTASSGKVLGKAADCTLCPLCFLKALRSSEKSSKPVYVSIGHKISLDTAVRLTHCCCRYRVPEPIRQVLYTRRLISQLQTAEGKKEMNSCPRAPLVLRPSADFKRPSGKKRRERRTALKEMHA